MRVRCEEMAPMPKGWKPPVHKKRPAPIVPFPKSKVHRAINHAWEICEEKGPSPECKVAWDVVEELSSVAHRIREDGTCNDK